jgi:hypothetical protein
MTTPEAKTSLLLFKTLVDQNKSQLIEISLRHDAMITHLPDAISGPLYVQLDNYLRQLRSTLSACEAVSNAIDRTLAESE